MDVRIIDMSILTNILYISHMNQNYAKVIEEFKRFKEQDKEDLLKLSLKFPNSAMRGTGLGDLL